MPNVGHSQTNSNGPLGGSGQAHQRETNECGPPPPANGQQHRARGLGIVFWPAAGAADGLAAVGELQAEAEGSPGRGQITWSAGRVVFRWSAWAGYARS